MDKNVNLAAIDRSFIATNARKRDFEGPSNASNALCRFEFMEIMVRLGSEKFRGPGLVKTFTEATLKLIEEVIIPHSKLEPWQEFRDELLWVLEIDELFYFNLENLQ
jgi:hypothetical protein